jgi:hypothetical protein
MSCLHCKLWDTLDNVKGLCRYKPPPVVTRIYNQNQAELALLTNWQPALDQNTFVTEAAFSCSEFRYRDE